MKLENRMSLGYQKGRYWVPDDRFAQYAQRGSYKALLRAVFKAGFGTNVEYSYNARVYMAEIITIERFKGSANPYIVKHNNAYDANPMAALSKAIRASDYATPLVKLCCLEIEAELLREAVVAAQKRERLMAKLEAAIDALAAVFQPPYRCENCLGMIEHGCYCQAMGCPAPGVPPVDEDDDL